MLTLRPSFEALIAAEQELGPLFALVERAAAGGLSLGEMVALFWHCRVEAPEHVTRDQVGEAVAAGGLAAATPVLRVLLGQILGTVNSADRLPSTSPTAPHPPTAARRVPPCSRGGEGCFAVSAARLAGLAGVLLGWSPDQFWRATPAELACVLEAMAAPSVDAVAGSADLARLRKVYPDG